MQNHIFIHMAIFTLKIGVVLFQGPFFTYLVRSWIGFLTQVSGHTVLENMKLKLQY